MVRRIGGRKSHPGFHRVLSYTALVHQRGGALQYPNDVRRVAYRRIGFDVPAFARLLTGPAQAALDDWVGS
ncbi:protein of unassigned function [Methylobacterium oryzae CBMB20]|uniref:Protein of unassigned function n=1 Tax=Methylobacterium oryzae CBMB20 TaxID=693986 RepID=A0A089NR61_9HYPH|nr:protein of unassigned function [Methylobacterium oryzae CBMB20]